MKVDIFASRDLDSRITEREIAAVNEFLNSGLLLHSMRDHPFHGVVLLAGAWGTVLTRESARPLWRKAWREMFADNITWAGRGVRGPDQDTLGHVWNVFGSPNNTMQHDSYTCQWFKGSVGWPTQRKIEPNNFVGAIIAENLTLNKTCPKECRRKNKDDWEYC